MNGKPNQSERLLERVHSELRRRRVTVHQMALEAGCHYQTLYQILHPERRSSQRVGRPRFSYEAGKSMELWLQSKHANRKQKQ